MIFDNLERDAGLARQNEHSVPVGELVVLYNMAG